MMVRWIVEPQIREEQCVFCPEHETVDQLYTFNRVLDGAWEFSQPFHVCFVDLIIVEDNHCISQGVLRGDTLEVQGFWPP